MTSRADLHVHSKHSNRPTEWILRQVQAPESYTEPLEVYRLCRERGMDFVTLSDHDSIAGALEIAHLPGTFLSSEVTVEFPEDGCEIHCLVTGVTEAQHREIQSLRKNVYELRDYLRERDVLHSIAHPLFRVNDRLTLSHFEKLVVLFNRFEALNGIHDRRANGLVKRILGSLTPETVFALAERHRLEPLGPSPWVKTFTGGSDDHGGVYVAATYTQTPAAATVEEYLSHLREGRHEPGGDSGATLRLVQSFYSITWEFYRRQFPALLGNRHDPFAELLRGLALGPAEKVAERPIRLRDRLAQVVAFPGVRRNPAVAPGATSGDEAETVHRATFMAAGKAQRDSLTGLVQDFVRQLRHGRLAESLSALSHLAPLALTLAPYLVALHAQHKDADLLEAAALRFLGQLPEAGRPASKAWFTDALTGSGAGKALRALNAVGRDGVTAITCAACATGRSGLAEITELPGLPVRAFEPLLRLPLPGAEPRQLAVPPILEILDHCERERYSEILVSTPGPLGLAGLAAGKLLGIRLIGFYPADLPQHIQRTAGSPALEDLAWSCTRWFYGQMDRVYVAGHRDRRHLAERGFNAARIELLPRKTRTADHLPLESEAMALESVL